MGSAQPSNPTSQIHFLCLPTVDECDAPGLDQRKMILIYKVIYRLRVGGTIAKQGLDDWIHRALTGLFSPVLIITEERSAQVILLFSIWIIEPLSSVQQIAGAKRRLNKAMRVRLDQSRRDLACGSGKMFLTKAQAGIQNFGVTLSLWCIIMKQHDAFTQHHGSRGPGNNGFLCQHISQP